VPDDPDLRSNDCYGDRYPDCLSLVLSTATDVATLIWHPGSGSFYHRVATAFDATTSDYNPWYICLSSATDTATSDDHPMSFYH